MFFLGQVEKKNWKWEDAFLFFYIQVNQSTNQSTDCSILIFFDSRQSIDAQTCLFKPPWKTGSGKHIKLNENDKQGEKVRIKKLGRTIERNQSINRSINEVSDCEINIAQVTQSINRSIDRRLMSCSMWCEFHQSLNQSINDLSDVSSIQMT